MTTTLRIFLAAGCIATVAWQAAAAQADNIAFINVARVMQEAPQAAAARERLQSSVPLSCYMYWYYMLQY